MRFKAFGLATAVVMTSMALSASGSASPISVAGQIHKLEDQVNAAYAANDLPVYFSFYADDLRALYPDGPTTLPAYRADWTAFIKGGGAIESFKDTDMHIQVSPGGDVAVASYLASVRIRTPGKGVATSSFSETDVWFRRHGRWKIVEIHYSENPMPQK